MKILGLRILEEFGGQHTDVQKQIGAWCLEVEEAKWQSPMDVKRRYASASLLGNNRIVFNLKGNKYRLDVKVSFKNQVVLVKRIATHAEYSKWKFS